MRSICAVAVFVFCLRGVRADTIPAAVVTSSDSTDTGPDLTTVAADDTLGLSDDPEWTTLENNELTENLLALITSLGGNSTDIAALFAPGAVLADSGTDLGIDGSSGAFTDSTTPEPATMGLLGVALLLLSYLALRRRVAENNLKDGPLQ